MKMLFPEYGLRDMIDVRRSRRARLRDNDKKYELLLREFKKEKYLYPPEPEITPPKRVDSYLKIAAGVLSAMILAGLIILSLRHFNF